MEKFNYQEKIKAELKKISPILSRLGFELEKKQLHIGGERIILSQKKLVLLGVEKSTGNHIIIKCSKFKEGIDEIKREKEVRDHLIKTKFALDELALPKEIFFGEKNGYIIFITKYIDQEKIFVEHSLPEQFFMALRALERQESFHATTYEHLNAVKNVFEVLTSQIYSERFDYFIKNINKNYKNSEMPPLFEKTREFFKKNLNIINAYSYYLIHEDLVPHNFRINNSQIHTLDCASLHYGNKYESWARFLNYMIIHNPELENKLTQYIKNSRGENEYLCLRLMRIFKITQLINYHSGLLDKIEGNFLALTKMRLNFWLKIMSQLLEDKKISAEDHSDYIQKRDVLRSEEEKERQREFAKA
ncbi:MAG: hypothetical protein HYW71_00545 [Candidatus Niyogibacteria bacterium]|nr:hypothetical protein [Candidatus Niyogibacteria bacterium]